MKTISIKIHIHSYVEWNMMNEIEDKDDMQNSF